MVYSQNSPATATSDHFFQNLVRKHISNAFFCWVCVSLPRWPWPWQVDERLCMKPDGSDLLGCHPSYDGELWACYVTWRTLGTIRFHHLPSPTVDGSEIRRSPVDMVNIP